MNFAGLKAFVRNWILPPAFYSVLKRPRKTPSLQSPEVNNNVTKENGNLLDTYKGKRCFILGGGSSVKQQDLKRMQGEFVISVSNTYVHPDYASFRPGFHVLPPILFGHSKLYSEAKFISWLKEMDEKLYGAEIFMHLGDKRLVDENKIFGNRKIHWVEYCKWNGEMDTPVDLARIPHIWSVSELAITIAVYMGFDEIYLLGFDHDWFNGPLVYFYDAQKEHLMQPTKESLKFADSEFQMRRHADIFKKYKYLFNIRKNIYNANANPSSYVDIFPRVKYESLFDK
jgi:hypothetical protein